jgi:hypothetical protein
MSQYEYSTSVVDKLLYSSGLAPCVLETDLRTRVLLIGPKEAAALLKANGGNRKLRPSRVKYYRDLILSGEFRLTHQGIAFSKTGRGMDLQHRLQAIIQSEKVVPLLVTEGLLDSDFHAIDQHEKRTLSDSHSKPKRLMEEVNFLIYYCWIRENVKNLPSMILSMSDMIETQSAEIFAACPSNKPGRTDVPTRCAAIVAMLAEPKRSQEIFMRYRTWALSKSEAYTYSMHAMARHLGNKRCTSSMIDRSGKFVKISMIFDNKCDHLRNIRGSDNEQDVMRKKLSVLLPKPKHVESSLFHPGR